MRHLIAGNWKMNGLAAQPRRGGARWPRGCEALKDRADAMLCPPATLIAQMRWRTAKSALLIGGQDCHPKRLGRPHRRYFRGNAEGRRRQRRHRRAFRAADRPRRDGRCLSAPRRKPRRRAGLTAIICIGETEEERDAGQTLDVVGRQLARLRSRTAARRHRRSPTSRSGRSAPAGRRAPVTLQRSMPISGALWRHGSAARARMCASSMEVR